MTDGATTLSEVISRRTSRLADVGRGLNALCCLPVQVSFRQLAQFFVCAPLLLKNVVQDAFILAEPELLSPGRKRPVNRDFVMLDALCRGNHARITAIPIENHFCPSLRLANDGVHRAVWHRAPAPGSALKCYFVS